jgi:hypothetical protein
MSIDYATIKADAAAAVQEAGKPITLTVITQGGFDPVTGEPTTTETDHSGYAVEENIDLRLIESSLVQDGDQQLLCVDIPEPRAGQDKLTVDGTEKDIVRVGRIQPGDTAILYRVWVR